MMDNSCGGEGLVRFDICILQVPLWSKYWSMLFERRTCRGEQSSLAWVLVLLKVSHASKHGVNF